MSRQPKMLHRVDDSGGIGFRLQNLERLGVHVTRADSWSRGGSGRRLARGLTQLSKFTPQPQQFRVLGPQPFQFARVVASCSDGWWRGHLGHLPPKSRVVVGEPADVPLLLNHRGKHQRTSHDSEYEFGLHKQKPGGHPGLRTDTHQRTTGQRRRQAHWRGLGTRHAQSYGNRPAADRHAALPKDLAQLLQGAADTFLGGILVRAESRAHFGQTPPRKETQYHRVAVRLGQSAECGIEDRLESRSVAGFRGLGDGRLNIVLLHRLLFSLCPANFAANLIRRRVTCRPVKPTSQYRADWQAGRFPRQVGEHHLSHVPRGISIATDPPGRPPHQIAVAADQFRESVLCAVIGVASEQFVIWGVVHRVVISKHPPGTKTDIAIYDRKPIAEEGRYFRQGTATPKSFTTVQSKGVSYATSPPTL